MIERIDRDGDEWIVIEGNKNNDSFARFIHVRDISEIIITDEWAHDFELIMTNGRSISSKDLNVDFAHLQIIIFSKRGEFK